MDSVDGKKRPEFLKQLDPWVKYFTVFFILICFLLGENVYAVFKVSVAFIALLYIFSKRYMPKLHEDFAEERLSGAGITSYKALCITQYIAIGWVYGFLTYFPFYYFVEMANRS